MSSRIVQDDEPEDDRTLPEFLKDAALQPYRILTSPLAGRIYLRTALLFCTALVLLALSVTAYAFFYYTYIPALGFTVPLHLQFSPSYAHQPFALAKVPRGILKSQQPYNVAVRLCLPYTTDNVDVGNFMIETEVRGPEEAQKPADPVASEQKITELVAPVLAYSSRPALLLPEAWLVTTARRLLRLPLLIVGWTRETTCLDVPVFEGIEFGRGWRNQPDLVKVEVAAQGGPIRTLRILEAGVEWTTVFGGLRYLVWNHRILSAIVGVSSFWLTSLMTTSLVWVTLSYTLSALSSSDQEKTMPQAIRREGDQSDSLRARERQGITQPEVQDEDSRMLHPKKEEEADDEDENAGTVLDDPSISARLSRDDSGIGTSLESSGPANSPIARRKKNNG